MRVHLRCTTFGFAGLILATVFLLQVRCASEASRDMAVAKRNAASAAAAAISGDAGAPAAAPTPRKIRQNATLRLIVGDVRKTAQEIETLADHLGGFVGNANISAGRDQVEQGTITIRVPTGSFSQAMGEIQKKAIKVLQSQTSADDVTNEYVDLEARIKNLRVEEAQIQEIMKRAGTVDDTLRVAQQLSSVREQIERLQGQLQLLARQVELATINVELSAELPAVDSDAERSGLGTTWRKSVREMKEGFSGYAESMLAFLLRLPVMLLWLATFGLFIYAAWRLLFWFFRRLRDSRPPSPPPPPAPPVPPQPLAK